MFGQKKTGIDASAFEYDARYQPQSTEDSDNAAKQVQKKSNYRPTPLRWYFIVVIIAILGVYMGLVIWARQAMPNSDNTFTLEDKRWLAYRDDVVAIRTEAAPLPTSLPEDVDLHQLAAEELRRAAEDFAIFERAVHPSETPAAETPVATPAATPAKTPAGQTPAANPPETPAGQTPAANPPETPAGKSPAASPPETPAQKTPAGSPPETPAQKTPAASPAAETPAASPGASEAGKFGMMRQTTIIVSKFSSVVTVPGTVATYTSSVPTVYYSISMSHPTASERVITETITTVITTKTKVPTVISVNPSVEKTTRTFIETQWSVFPKPGQYLNMTGTDMPMSSSAYEETKTETNTITRGGTALSTETEIETEITDTATTVYTSLGAVPTGGVEVSVPISTGYTMSVIETTAKPSTYVTIGEVTITSVYTEPAPDPSKNDQDKGKNKGNDDGNDKDKGKGKGDEQDQPKQQDPTPKVIDVVSVKPDETIEQVKQLGPVTYVKSVPDVEKVVASQGPITMVVPADQVETTMAVVTTGPDGVVRTQNVVTQVQAGVYQTTVAVVRTGADGKLTTEQVVSTVQMPGAAYETTMNVVTTGADGLLTTKQVVTTVQPGSYETTMNIVTTGADGLLTTKQVVTTVPPGSYETTMNIVTTGADGRPTTKQVVTMVQSGSYETTLAIVTTGTDGLPTTLSIVSTVNPNELVTTVDIVTTGTDGLPTTKKVPTTLRGPLKTIVSTPSGLTTFTTTKSGHLSTITSTPSGSTTITSTRKGTTLTESSTIMETPTATGDPDKPIVKTVTKVIKSTDGSYFVGKFLPVILAVLISIPVRIIDTNAQLYQPFYALNNANGGTGKNTMTLHFSGFVGFIRPFTILSEGQPVPFITMLIVICSALMTPLATEAISLKLHGRCKLTAAEGCAIALGVSPTPTHALIALIAFTIVLLCALLYFLRNWETGLYANPWSIVGMASLATNQQIRPRKCSEKKIEKEMADKKFGFGYFENAHGETEYGIVLYDDAGQTLRQEESGTQSETSSIEIVPQKKKRANPFIALGWAWRLGFIAFLLGLIILVLYYHLLPDKDKDTDFEKFINGQTFGVRFFFSAMGVLLSFGWTALFISKHA